MVKEFINGKMVTFTMVYGLMAIKKAKVFSHLLMVIVMKATSKMILSTVMEFMNGLMATNTMVNGLMAIKKAKGFSNLLVVIAMKAATKMIKNTIKELIIM